eukprot:SAG31_NODE_1955_length_6823_cov_2.519780_3_plen_577_part_00
MRPSVAATVADRRHSVCSCEFSSSAAPVAAAVNAVTDGALFYFQGVKMGQAKCRRSAACKNDPYPPSACHGAGGQPWACLWDTCAEASVPNGLLSEIADFETAMPPENELHVGIYSSGYGPDPCRATPSVNYVKNALHTALTSPAVTGVMVYTLTQPQSSCPNATDRGCVVRDIFGSAGAYPAALPSKCLPPPPAPAPLVGVHYFAGWYPGPWSHWLYPTEPLASRKSWVPDYPGRIPLTGNFTTNQSTVEADLRAADGYGVDFFEVLWSDPAVVGGGSSCDGGHNPADPNFHPCVDIGLAWMLNSSIWPELKGGLHFLVSYSTDFDGTTVAKGMFNDSAVGAKTWESYCRTWIRLMAHPRYLRIDGRPVFKILGPSNFLAVQCVGNGTLAQQRIDQFRALAQGAGVGNPIIGGGWVTGSTGIPERPYQGVNYDFTGVYGWAIRDPALGPCQPGEVYPFAQMDEMTNAHWETAHAHDAVPYVPNVMASLDARPALEKGCAYAPPTRTEWTKTLQRAKALVEKPGARLGFPSSSAPDGVHPALTIYAWNEFQEGGIVCPTKGEGWLKLEAIKEVFQT